MVNVSIMANLAELPVTKVAGVLGVVHVTAPSHFASKEARVQIGAGTKTKDGKDATTKKKKKWCCFKKFWGGFLAAAGLFFLLSNYDLLGIRFLNVALEALAVATGIFLLFIGIKEGMELKKKQRTEQ